MLRKFLDETLEATQFQGQYDFKEFRYGEVLLILAEALFEQNGQISDGDLDQDHQRIAHKSRHASAYQCPCHDQQSGYADRDQKGAYG